VAPLALVVHDGPSREVVYRTITPEPLSECGQRPILPRLPLCCRSQERGHIHWVINGAPLRGCRSEDGLPRRPLMAWAARWSIDAVRKPGILETALF
jgi:hypothetical protein